MRKTILFTVALALAWALPGMAAKPDIPPGQLVKAASSSAVYYIDEDLTRHVFPNARVFQSWYDGFGEIITVEDEDISEFPLSGTVPYKPGKRLIKIQTDPRVYAVDDGGVLRWVKSEAAARALYGKNWNKFVDDLPDSYFANYTMGEDVDDSQDFDPEMKQQGKKIGHVLKDKRLKHQNKNQAGNLGENRGFGRDKVAVCHGFAKKPHTIFVSQAALKAHLAHGDSEGPCAGDDGDDQDGDDDDDTPADTTAPTVSNVSVLDITASTASVSWETDEPTTYSLYFDTDTSVVSAAPGFYDNSSVVATAVSGSVLESLHQVILDSLEALTEYFYKIVAADEAGNETSSDVGFLTTASTAGSSQ